MTSTAGPSPERMEETQPSRVIGNVAASGTEQVGPAETRGSRIPEQRSRPEEPTTAMPSATPEDATIFS